MHPLSEPYFSQAPMRWGDHVAKVGVYPTQALLESVAELEIEARDDHDAFRSAMRAHFAAAGAEFELRVQLATDLDETPIENAAREWPDEHNPYRTVARLVLPAQAAWTSERDDHAEGHSFSPANSLAAHRPLGQVMRTRLFVNGRLADWRLRHNGRSPAAAGVEAMPD